jgi:molecular chaperone GrpE
MSEENKKQEELNEDKKLNLNEEVQENNQEMQDEQNEEQVNQQDEEVSCEEELAKEKDKFLRLFAEFENYKRRTAKERIELIKTASKDLISEILPVIDDFERGLAEIKKAKDKELLKGMELIYKKLLRVLESKGLEKIKVKNGDEFNPEIHEAITQIPAPNKKMVGKIIDVLENGYKLGDTVIRYPKVVVGK